MVAIVISTINAFAGGCFTSDFFTGPLHFFSADSTIRLIALENNITGSSVSCDNTFPESLPLRLDFVIGEPFEERHIVLPYYVLHLLWYVLSLQRFLHYYVGH